MLETIITVRGNGGSVYTRKRMGQGRTHGRPSTYNIGCRCDSCMVAQKSYNKIMYSKHLDRHRQWGRDNWAKNKVQKTSQRLEKSYGITYEQRQDLLERQNYGCAICSGKSSDSLGRTLAVDHCHTTGRVRGLLCSKCNFAVGLLDNDPSRAQKLIEYLGKE